MSGRNNALSVLTRFWLQSRHGCLVDEAIPVKIHHNYSDIDWAAVRLDARPWPSASEAATAAAPPIPEILSFRLT